MNTGPVQTLGYSIIYIICKYSMYQTSKIGVDFEKVRRQVLQVIDETHELTQLPRSAIIELLLYAKFNQNKVSDLINLNDKDDFYDFLLQRQIVTSTQRTEFYGKCAECQKDDNVTLLCRHAYCYSCLKNYVEKECQKLVSSNEQKDFVVKCPWALCEKIFPPDFLEEIYPDYFDALCEHFIKLPATKYIRCPDEYCGRLYIWPSNQKEIKCECGLIFCYRCALYHPEVPCDISQRWLTDQRNEKVLELFNSAFRVTCQKEPHKVLRPYLIAINVFCTTCHQRRCVDCQNDWDETHTQKKKCPYQLGLLEIHKQAEIEYKSYKPCIDSFQEFDKLLEKSRNLIEETYEAEREKLISGQMGENSRNRIKELQPIISTVKWGYCTKFYFRNEARIRELDNQLSVLSREVNQAMLHIEQIFQSEKARSAEGAGRLQQTSIEKLFQQFDRQMVQFKMSLVCMQQFSLNYD